MDVFPILAFSDNYIWALVDKKTKVFDCVDPGDAQPVLQFATDHQLNLRSILITHHHDDHIGGAVSLRKLYPSCTVYGPDDPRIPVISTPVSPGQVLSIGTHTFQILSNPGHTSSHISYFEPDKKWLFCGDTLFSAGCGRVFDGSVEQLHDSIVSFKALPKATLVFCAHEYTQQNLRFAQVVEPHNTQIKYYLQRLQEQQIVCSLPSTLEQEFLINPFLRTNEKEVQHYARQHGAHSRESQEVFRVLREQKNLFR